MNKSYGKLTETFIKFHACVWLQGWGNSVSKTTRVSCTTSTRCAHRWTTTRYASANRATTSSLFPGLPTLGAVFAPKVHLHIYLYKVVVWWYLFRVILYNILLIFILYYYNFSFMVVIIIILSCVQTIRTGKLAVRRCSASWSAW